MALVKIHKVNSKPKFFFLILSNILNKFLKFAKFEPKHFVEYNLTKKCAQGKMYKGGQELFSFFIYLIVIKKLQKKKQKLDSSQKFKVKQQKKKLVTLRKYSWFLLFTTTA